MVPTASRFRAALAALALVALPTSIARAQSPLFEEEIEPADLVVLGRIYTGDPEHQRASFMAVRGDRIVHLGEARELATIPAPGWVGPRTRILRRDPGAILPGFHDAHAHATIGLGLPMDLDLTDAGSIEDVVERVAVHIKRNRDDELILGYGWNPLQTILGTQPHRELLDEASPERPVVLFSEGPNAAWVNTVALKRLGVIGKKGSLPGALVPRDDTRQPTGLLFGPDLVRSMRRLVMERDRETYDTLVKGLATLSRHGITSIQEPVSAGLVHQIARLFDRGELKVRFHIQDDGTGALEELKETFARRDWITFETAEAAAKRAALWSFASHSEPGRKGRVPSLDELIEQSRQRGLRSCFHVTPFARSPQVQGFLFPERAIERLVEAKAIVTVTPSYLAKDLLVPNIYESLYGTARAPLAMPLRSLLDAGLPLAFGSEFPQNALDPYVGLAAACSRRPPSRSYLEPWNEDQAITVEEAVRAYTLTPAILQGAEKDKGTLTPGKLADFVMLDVDPFTVDPKAFPRFRVTHTIVGGKIVYRAE